MREMLNLMDLSIEELEKLMNELGQPSFRAKQIFKWVQSGISSIDDMTNLSKDLRIRLNEIAHISTLKIYKKFVSRLDETRKYLFELNDGNIIESVLMKYKHGLTVCATTQVGCRMGCAFCASTGIGFIRNLSAGEITAQVLAIQKDTGERVRNVVLMGIGEPFDNYDNVIKFLKIVNHQEGLNIGNRRITISTCGLVERLYEFMDLDLQVNISISLHAPNDEIRKKIMPVGNAYNMGVLLKACRDYTQRTHRRITFEYALIEGVNDEIAHAKELGLKIKGMLCHVNLIPLNKVQGNKLNKSSRSKIEEFKQTLEHYGIETTIRRELGTDINAACGQLRRSIIENSH